MDELQDRLRGFQWGYSKWLTEQLGMEDHTELFRILYETEFTWSVDRDENRATDGIYMRDRYSYETGEPLPENWRDWPCSMVEMMASLAFTMEESFLYDPDEDTSSAMWMREMLENCRLWEVDDETFESNPLYSEEYISRRVSAVLNREYSYSGRYGMFPLENPAEDQRRVEIWRQMNAYVLERWPL